MVEHTTPATAGSAATDPILRIRAAAAYLGISVSTLYDWLNPRSPRHDPTFPRPISLGAKSSGFRLSALNHWLEQRAQASGEAA